MLCSIPFGTDGGWVVKACEFLSIETRYNGVNTYTEI